MSETCTVIDQSVIYDKKESFISEVVTSYSEEKSTCTGILLVRHSENAYAFFYKNIYYSAST